MTTSAFSDEQILRCGPSAGSAVLLVPPLFEEANRLRRTLVQVMHALADEGIGSLLPDLAGQNESLIPTVEASLSSWTRHLAEIAHRERRPLIVASFRGGSLIDDEVSARGYWRCAPLAGPVLIKGLLRTARLSSQAIASAQDRRNAVQLAGNWLSAKMVEELGQYVPHPLERCRTVMVGPNGSDGDRLAGSPLWLRAEPSQDSELVKAITLDIIQWAEICDAI